MNEIYQLIQERNARETDPFVSVHEANAALLNLTDALEARCSVAEREVATLRQQLQDAALVAGGGSGKGVHNAALTAALKNETRLRDKLEKLQEESNAKLKAESEVQAEALKTAKRLQEVQDLNTAYEKVMVTMKEEIEQQKQTMSRMEDKVKEAEAGTKLAEQQYDGLKKTIRTLQEENDALKKENRILEGRLVEDKSKLVEEMNVLTEMVDGLKKEVDMLRSLKHQEETRKKVGWFSPKKDTKTLPPETKKGEGTGTTARKFGNFGVIVPSTPKQTVQAHNMEGTCVRYDDSGPNLVATASCDGTVKVWDTQSGTVRATLRGSSGHAILACDMAGALAVGGGTDKTCRVWNLRTERMIHHLVGHQHKITCVRMFANEKAVLTGSADRSLKVWNIAHKTYRQTTTLRHSSTSTCVDVASDSVTAVSGHMDGGIRLWDLRSGERMEDISSRSSPKNTHAVANVCLVTFLLTLQVCSSSLLLSQGSTRAVLHRCNSTRPTAPRF